MSAFTPRERIVFAICLTVVIVVLFAGVVAEEAIQNQADCPAKAQKR